MARPKTISDETLQETARRCFLEHGPALSVSTIAAELGISDAAIIKRVGSKEQLLRSCLAVEEPTPWLKPLQSGPQPGPLQKQLVELLEAISATIKERVPTLIALRLSDINMHEIIGLDGPDAPPLKVRRLVAKWLRRARTTHGLNLKDPAATADLLVSSALSRGFFHWISHGVIPQTDWRELVAAALAGASTTDSAPNL